MPLELVAIEPRKPILCEYVGFHVEASTLGQQYGLEENQLRLL